MRHRTISLISFASGAVGLAAWVALSMATPATATGPGNGQSNTADLTSSAPPPASRQPEGRAIEASKYTDALSSDDQRRLLIKIETLLDRAHFSPGMIDGTPGENLHNAIAAYAEAHKLASQGTVNAELFKALTGGDKAPVTQDYTITADDEKGPFIGSVPNDFVRLAKLKHLGYRSPEQALAEKFHVSEGLLRALNPGADFNKTGTSLLVPRPGNGDIGTDVARIEVDKGANQLRVFDNAGTLVAVFPATVGSTERPAPSGRWAVSAVTFNPTYTYDPKVLTFGPKHKGVLKIAPGPNNPVGLVWMELTKPTFGIHGAPNPELVGKTASHGCVRLTNWDAEALGHAVKPGTPVILTGQTTKG